MKYRADIDGLRALAVVSVMLYHVHARWLPGGFVGVDVFFVISGFVVSASLAASSQRHIGGYIAEFYARRLARIAPALIVMLCVAALAANLFIPQSWLSEFSDRTALYAFFGLGNWVMQTNSDTYFAPRAEFNPYTHTWTLGVEEQFYIICPILLFLWVSARVRGGARRPRLPLALLTVLGAASLIGCAWATRAQPTSAFYSIVFRFWELAAGVLLFLVSSSRETRETSRHTRLALLAPIAGLALVLATMAFASANRFPYPWALVVVAGTLLMIGGVGAATAHPLRKLLSKPAAVWIGKRSYSLYLWHWPIFVVARWTIGFDRLWVQALAVVATFAFASASYRLVELPLRHNAALQRFRPIVRIALFLLVIVGARRMVQRLFWNRRSISLSIVSRNADDWYADTRMSHPNASRRTCSVVFGDTTIAGGEIFTYRPTRCSGTADPRTLTAIGDSHARAYLPMLEELSAERGIRVTVYTFPGCPYLDLLRPMNEGKPAGCLEFMRWAGHEALAAEHPGDLLFLPSLRQWRLGDEWATFAELNADSLLHSPRGAAQIDSATSEAVAWLSPYVAKGVSVLFEAPPPLFPSPPFRCSDRFNSGNPICRAGLTESRAHLEHMREPIVHAMDEVKSRLPSVRVWNPFAILCAGERCTAFRDGRPLFFDGDHISGYGNSVLYPSFNAMIAELETPHGY